MKKKLVSVIGLWVLVVGVAIGWLNYFETQRQLQSLMDAQLREAAQIILDQAMHEMREHYYENTEDTLREELFDDRNLPMVEFQILGEQSQLILRSSKLLPLSPLSKNPNGFDMKDIATEPWRVFVLWSKDKKFQVQVAQKISFRKQLTQNFLINILLPLLLLLPLLMLFISIAISRSFKPLELLALEVKNRGPSDLAPIEVKGIHLDLELKPIVDEMNALLSRLQKALISEKRLTANAAHELRTPLAQIKLQTQIAQSAESLTQKQSALQTINEVVDKLTRRVAQLLAFARLDHEFMDLPRRNFDLQKVLKDEVAAQVPQCLNKNIEVSVDSEFFELMGYEDLFAVLIRNLLENAIKYTSEGGTIRIALEKQKNNTAKLEIVDSGPGISKVVIDNLFNENRPILSSKDGTGIGMSLVKKIADLHGAQLSIQNRSDANSANQNIHGLIVTLQIPSDLKSNTVSN